MSEKLILLESINPIEFYGPNEDNINILRNTYNKIKIIVRGDLIKLIGEDIEIAIVEEKIDMMIKHFDNYGKIKTDNVLDILRDGYFSTADVPLSGDDIIVHGRNGLTVKARSANQRKMVESYSKSDLIFAIGPAGSGKTYTAVALAVRALKNREVKRIILTRPAVEAGENLGFLPGDMKEKLDPYLQPLYDALRDMIPPPKLKTYMEDGTIEIAPLAFMRGRTLDNAIAILDEAQNATESQLKMFLTRMGKSAKFFVTGDITQIDLPRHQASGLIQATNILQDIEGIEFIFLNEKDIVRHALVTKIVEAYSIFTEKNLNQNSSFNHKKQNT